MTTLTVFQGFESLLIANERFHDKKEGDGGFQNERILFKGMKLAYDNACGTGRMYFLNEKFLKLYYIAGRWMKMLKEVEPANQTITVHRVRSVVQLVATQPRRLGVVTAIT